MSARISPIPGIRHLLMGLSLSMVGFPALANSEHCANQASSPDIHFADNPGFDHYRQVLIDPIGITARQADWLDRHQRARLSAVFRNAVALEWRERFGWVRTRDPGPDVIRLHVQINEVHRSGGVDSLNMDVSLADSLSGRELLIQCNKTLTLNPPHLAATGDTGLPWNNVQQTVMHWGAGLGSHIMTFN